MRLLLLVAAALVLTGASWIDPYAKAREASTLYEKGDFAGATQKYNEALTDDPDSFLLQYNRGASLYRENKLEDAVAAFGRAPAADPAETAYNIGNAKYRLGAATAESDPQKALGLYAEALAAYRRAMGANPDDVDAKFNHELVEKKIDELKKKIEEQKKEQEQQQQDQQQSQDQKDQQQQKDQQDQQQKEQGDQQSPQEQAQQDQEQHKQEQEDQQQTGQQDQQKTDQQQDSAEQQAQQPKPEVEQNEQRPQEATAHQPADQAGSEEKADGEQQQAQSAVSGERREGEMSEHEARALLDAARDQEVRPDEIIERMQGAAVLEPSEDW